jgi:16S rRNA (uracil1498-N3)-methyltransferase
VRRFFISKDILSDGNAVIAGNLFRHMAKVLRLKIGTKIILTDEDGASYTGLITKIGRESLTASIENTVLEPDSETGPRITLYQGLPKGSKMEFILQKGTELGVFEVIPFVAGRSIPRLTKDREIERLERWQRIVREAARQSNRQVVPDISPIRDFPDILSSSAQSVKLLLWEKEKSNGLKRVLSALPVPGSVAVMVGPEGGLTQEEAEAAIRSGFIPVTLGRRILRTETAPIAVLAILQFFWGDMG